MILNQLFILSISNNLQLSLVIPSSYILLPTQVLEKPVKRRTECKLMPAWFNINISQLRIKKVNSPNISNWILRLFGKSSRATSYTSDTF